MAVQHYTRAYTIREKVYNVTARGLKPHTLHNIFFGEKKLEARFVRPISSAYGTPGWGNYPVSDANGVISFKFRLTLEINPAGFSNWQILKQEAQSSNETKYLVAADYYASDNIPTPSAGWNAPISQIQTSLAITSFAAFPILDPALVEMEGIVTSKKSGPWRAQLGRAYWSPPDYSRV